jgi:hypothetical protein
MGQDRRYVESKALLFLPFRIVCGASVTRRVFASRQYVRVCKFRIKQFGFFEVLRRGFRALISGYALKNVVGSLFIPLLED